jgi:hypothetical protein
MHDRVFRERLQEHDRHERPERLGLDSQSNR